MNWLEQVERAGCGIACMAMLLETTYARVVEEAPMFCGGKCGVDYLHLDHFLASRGYAVQRLERDQHFSGERRAKWPPKPWAEKHLVLVTQTRADIDSHYVVMDSKGKVYDPSDATYVPSRLSRYYRVEWVAGVWKVG